METLWNDISFSPKHNKHNKYKGTYLCPQYLFLSEFKPPLTNIHNILSTWYHTLPSLPLLLPQALSYLSIWNILFPCVMELAESTRRYTTMVCCVGGLYMTWVHPVDIPVHYLHLYVEFPSSVVMDFIAHQLPFFFTWGLPWNRSWTWLWTLSRERKDYYHDDDCERLLLSFFSFLLTRWVVILYTLMIGVENAKKKYNVEEMDIIAVLVFSELFFFFFQQ